MFLSRLFFCFSLMLLSSCLQAQVAQDQLYKIAGRVVDRETQEGIIYGNVGLYDLNGDSIITGTATDFDGRYQLEAASGYYRLKFSYVGYKSVLMDSVKLDSEYMSVNISLEEGEALSCIIINGYAPVPIRNQSYRASQALTSEEISRRSTRNVHSLQSSTAGVNQTDVDRTVNATDRRSFSNDVYVDGVRVVGGTTLPEPKTEPIAPNNESYAAIEESAYQDVWQQPLSTFSIDVDHASYTNIRRLINNDSDIPPDAVRIEELLNYFSYDYTAPGNGAPFALHSELSDCPWNARHQLLRIGLKGAELPEHVKQLSNFVFLLDVSGSMDSFQKLSLLKKALHEMLNALDAKDRIAIVVYAGASGLVLPSTEVRNKERILQALNNLEAGGSTAGGAGIELAYQVAKENFIPEGNNRIILATDGDFNMGVSNPGDLQRLIEEKRESGIFLTVTGFGMGNYKDDNLEKLANHGNGNYAYIDSEEEAERFFVRDLKSNFYTIAKDVKFQLEFNPHRVAAYRLIGYENRLLAAEDFNDDKKDAGELGPGHAVTALYELIPRDEVEAYQADIDPLRYQSTKALLPAAKTEELLFCKLRYKAPNGDKSQLITKALSPEMQKLQQSSADQQFAVSVAAFGLLLRGSAYKGDVDLNMVLKWARKGKGQDKEGDRKAFIQLVHQYDK